MWIYLIILIILISIYYKQFRCNQDLYGLPGPFCWPLVGALPSMGLNLNHILLSLWARRYGSVYKFSLLGNNFVVVTGTCAIKEALIQRNDDFSGRPYSFRTAYISRNYSDLVFTSSCYRTSWMRNIAKDAIESHAGGDNKDVMDDIIGDFLKSLKEKADGDPFDPRNIIDDTMIQIIYMLLFEEQLQNGHEDFKKMKKYNKAITEALGQTTDGLLLDSFPWIRHIYNRTFSKCKEALTLYTELYDSWKDRCQNENHIGGIARKLIKALQDKASNSSIPDLTDINTSMLLMNLIVSGHTLMSSLVCSLLNILVHHPEVQLQLQRENDNNAGGNEDIQNEDQNYLPYTAATVLELLRYAHPTPIGVLRKTLRETDLCGYKIPRNTNVIMNYWGQHHSYTLWKDPFRFQPERFLDEKGKLVAPNHPNRQNLMPFGLGERICISSNLSYRYLITLTRNIVLRFNLEPFKTNLVQPSCHPACMQQSMVMLPQEYKLRLVTRNPAVEHQFSFSSLSRVSSSESDLFRFDI